MAAPSLGCKTDDTLRRNIYLSATYTLLCYSVCTATECKILPEGLKNVYVALKQSMLATGFFIAVLLNFAILLEHLFILPPTYMAMNMVKQLKASLKV